MKTSGALPQVEIDSLDIQGAKIQKSFSQTFSKKLKGTVRPDWICMRVVSLESPLKGHQPLYVLNFLFFILNI